VQATTAISARTRHTPPVKEARKCSESGSHPRDLRIPIGPPAAIDVSLPQFPRARALVRFCDRIDRQRAIIFPPIPTPAQSVDLARLLLAASERRRAERTPAPQLLQLLCPLPQHLSSLVACVFRALDLSTAVHRSTGAAPPTEALPTHARPTVAAVTHPPDLAGSESEPDPENAVPFSGCSIAQGLLSSLHYVFIVARSFQRLLASATIHCPPGRARQLLCGKLP
jgi:hypothetical protein